jgi:hypothetical protein
MATRAQVRDDVKWGAEHPHSGHEGNFLTRGSTQPLQNMCKQGSTASIPLESMTLGCIRACTASTCTTTGTVDAVSAIDSFAGAVDEVNMEFVDELDADSDSDLKGDSYRKFNSSKASHNACSCAFLEL